MFRRTGKPIVRRFDESYQSSNCRCLGLFRSIDITQLPMEHHLRYGLSFAWEEEHVDGGRRTDGEVNDSALPKQLKDQA